MWLHNRILRGVSAFLLLITLSKPCVNRYNVICVNIYLDIAFSILSVWDTACATFDGDGQLETSFGEDGQQETLFSGYGRQVTSFGDVYGLAAFNLSMVSNVWATIIISFKAW